MTALSTLVESLKQELAVPGTFEDVFPDTDDDALLLALANGFAEAQLYGFFPDVTLDQTGVTGDTDYEFDTDPDLSLSGGALVVIFTSMRFLRSSIRAINLLEKYKAGPVEFEISKSSNALKAELDFLQKRLDDIIDNAKDAARPLAAVFDNYLARTEVAFRATGLYDYEYRG